MKVIQTKLNLLLIRLYRYFLKAVGFTGDKTSRVLFRLFQVAVYIVVIVFSFNLLFNQNGFGVWGDFFGGVLNPFLTFLTFMGLLLTIVLQSKELKETRKEVQRSSDALELQNQVTRKQSFEQTLFQMLSLHNEIVGSIDLYNSKKNITTKGRDCFTVFLTRFIDTYLSTKGDDNEFMLEEIRSSWNSFWEYHAMELAHYYRYLYNIIRFIDESEVEKVNYIRIVRSQLSDQELLLLFYNCLSEHGSENFKPLVERYSLLDNMPIEQLPDSEHIDLYDLNAFNKEYGFTG